MKFPFQLPKQKANQQRVFKKTLIAVPTTGVLYPAMVNDLIALLTSCRQWGIFHTVDNCVIQDARNQAVARMFETGCDAVLFIDSDQTFPKDALDVLIETHKEIVGYPIIRKTPPYYPNIGRWDEAKGEYVVYEDYPKNYIFQVDYIGMGFTYIRKEVFEKLEKPYFDFEWFVNEKYKKGERMVGEDVYFCKRAKAAGFKIWAYPMLEIGHIGNFEYLPRLYRNYTDVVKAAKEEENGKEKNSGSNQITGSQT